MVWIRSGKVIFQDSGIITPEQMKLKVITNNISELYAAVKAILSVPKEWDGKIYTDSLITYRRITTSHKFNGIPNGLKKLTTKLRTENKYMAKWIKGHPNENDLDNGKNDKGQLVSKYNVLCDDLCNELSIKILGGEVVNVEDLCFNINYKEGLF